MLAFSANNRAMQRIRAQNHTRIRFGHEWDAKPPEFPRPDAISPPFSPDCPIESERPVKTQPLFNLWMRGYLMYLFQGVLILTP